MSDFTFDFVFLPIVAVVLGTAWAAAMTVLLCESNHG